MRVASGGRPLSQVGEFQLIDIIDAVVGGFNPSRLRVGIGDDALVWRPRTDTELVVTSDMLVQNVHFRLEWFENLQSLGHKALAVNLSDIAAMGAIPRLAVVALGLTGHEHDRDVADFNRGLVTLARKNGVVIGGGDITTAPGGVTIAVTVIGESRLGGPPLMTRSAAHPGDWIGVTGPLGLAAAGLRVLQWNYLTMDGNPAMQQAYHRPIPRLREGRLLRRCGVRAAMDISDGLLGDLPKICQQSEVAAIVELPKVPIPNAIKWNFPDWFDIGLRGGDDYELLFTAPADVFERVCRMFKRAGLRRPYHCGEIIEAGEGIPMVRVRRADGKFEEVDTGAYTHFQ